MIYKIEKGKHSPNGLHMDLVWKKTMGRYMIIFDDTCRHSQVDTDWNKVCGWTYNIFPVKPWLKGKPAHHVNSIRMAVRFWIDYIELALYNYVDFKREESIFPYKLDYNTPHFLELGINKGMAYLKGLKGDIIHGKAQLEVGNPKLGLGYKLYPWYGGDHAAQQTMEFLVHEFYS